MTEPNLQRVPDFTGALDRVERHVPEAVKAPLLSWLGKLASWCAAAVKEMERQSQDLLDADLRARANDERIEELSELEGLAEKLADHERGIATLDEVYEHAGVTRT